MLDFFFLIYYNNSLKKASSLNMKDIIYYFISNVCKGWEFIHLYTPNSHAEKRENMMDLDKSEMTPGFLVWWQSRA